MPPLIVPTKLFFTLKNIFTQVFQTLGGYQSKVTPAFYCDGENAEQAFGFFEQTILKLCDEFKENVGEFMPMPNIELENTATPKDEFFIWKFHFPLGPGEWRVDLPEDSSVLDFQVQDSVGAMWVLLNPAHPKKCVTYGILPTGASFPKDWVKMAYMKTLQHNSLVWHLFRIKKEPHQTPSTPGDQVQD